VTRVGRLFGLKTTPILAELGSPLLEAEGGDKHPKRGVFLNGSCDEPFICAKIS